MKLGTFPPGKKTEKTFDILKRQAKTQRRIEKNSKYRNQPWIGGGFVNILSRGFYSLLLVSDQEDDD